MDPTKIKEITDYPQPENGKSLQSFLGLDNFSLLFLPQIATITQPLRLLLKKDTTFSWSKSCIESFQQIKRIIQEAAQLAFPDFSKTFGLQMDASNTEIGVVLLQQDHSDDWRPIVYIS